MLDLIDAHGLDDERPDVFDAGLTAVLDAALDVLRERMGATLETVIPVLNADARGVLAREHRRWQAATAWRLINAADPGGT